MIDDPTKSDGTKDRSRLIKLIHVGRRQLQMSDAAWRAYLKIAFSAESSTQLTAGQLKKALAHLHRIGFKTLNGQPNEWAFSDQLPEDKRKLMYKILKLMESPELRVARGAQVAYVEGIAKQMGGCNAAGNAREVIHKPLAMCSVTELRKIIAALVIHIKRAQASECTG